MSPAACHLLHAGCAATAAGPCAPHFLCCALCRTAAASSVGASSLHPSHRHCMPTQKQTHICGSPSIIHTHTNHCCCTRTATPSDDGHQAGVHVYDEVRQTQHRHTVDRLLSHNNHPSRWLRTDAAAVVARHTNTAADCSPMHIGSGNVLKLKLSTVYHCFLVVDSRPAARLLQTAQWVAAVQVSGTYLVYSSQLR